MAKKSKPLQPIILYEDEHLLAVNKPAGMATVPERWETAPEDLLSWVRTCRGSELTNAHRLDKNISGLVLFARSRAVLSALSRALDTGTAERTYLALTRPMPREPSGTIRQPLTPDRQQPGRMRVHPRGKTAVTEFTVVERFGAGYALLRVKPRTQRTHQIRVHLAWLGSPVLADPLYGDGKGLYLSHFKADYRAKKDRPEKPLIARPALHGLGITLTHPVTQRALTLLAPLPADMTLALKQLRKYSYAPS